MRDYLNIQCADYHSNYYGAFVRDPDGHNVEAVCHRRMRRLRRLAGPPGTTQSFAPSPSWEPRTWWRRARSGRQSDSGLHVRNIPTSLARNPVPLLIPCRRA